MEMEIVMEIEMRGSQEKLQRQKLLESILQIEQGGKQARIKWEASRQCKQAVHKQCRLPLCNDNCGEFGISHLFGF